MASNPVISIGKPAPPQPHQPPAPTGMPVPTGPTIHDANFEFITRLNALNLADKLISMANSESDTARVARMRANAYHLIDRMAAPDMTET